MYNSQKNRQDNPEVDPLLIGTGWTTEDLSKPQILIESTAGDSHPGSRHLEKLVQTAANGVYKAGGKPATFTVTDICDGLATGHEGMRYSLLSRDLITGMDHLPNCCSNAVGGSLVNIGIAIGIGIEIVLSHEKLDVYRLSTSRIAWVYER